MNQPKEGFNPRFKEFLRKFAICVSIGLIGLGLISCGQNQAEAAPVATSTCPGPTVNLEERTATGSCIIERPIPTPTDIPVFNVINNSESGQ